MTMAAAIAVVTCNSCGAVFSVEFNPPDDPTLRGRIELLVEPTRTQAAGTAVNDPDRSLLLPRLPQRGISKPFPPRS
jgi:hypothetical protein